MSSPSVSAPRSERQREELQLLQRIDGKSKELTRLMQQLNEAMEKRMLETRETATEAQGEQEQGHGSARVSWSMAQKLEWLASVVGRGPYAGQ